MIIHQLAGYLTITIEKDDFKTRNWKGFVQELKEKIPWGHRDYDPQQKEWRILDTDHNVEVVNTLYQRYFTDKNQLTLFNKERLK